MHRLLITVAAIAVFAAIDASPAGAVNSGDDLSAQPQVMQALADARAYWRGAAPNCPDGIKVTAADLAGASEVGLAMPPCALELDGAWLNAAPTRTQSCALVAHEYGHLLGYGHGDYPADTDKVMSQRGTPRYCRTFNANIPKLPKACSWPAWARTTERIRVLYAAGRRHAALLEFRRWRKKHPRAKLPGPCVLT